MVDLHPTIAPRPAAQLPGRRGAPRPARRRAARRAALDAGARRVGWKLAYGIAEVEELAGDEPVVGHLTSATLLAPGGAYHGASADRELRVETELAVEVGEGGAIAGLLVALEIVDVGRPPHGAHALVAANVLHRAVAFGPTRPGAGAPGGPARLLIGGALREEAPVRGDPAAVVAATARLLAAVGERLQPRGPVPGGPPPPLAPPPGG